MQLCIRKSFPINLDIVGLDAYINVTMRKDQRSVFFDDICIKANVSACLTLFGTGQGIFIPLPLLDQILSADFFFKNVLTLAGEN